jgi:ABC-type polysaccharide/polyol phosphate export permease
MRPWSKAYWSLVWELTRTEFKVRDQGTLLGFLWTLLHPALMFAVLYTVFVKWLGHRVDLYGPYLIIGLVQWQFFEKATTIGFSGLRRKSLLLKNFNFAREIVVLAGVGSVFLSYLLETLVMLAFVRLLHVPFAWKWLALPLHAAALLSLATATALILGLLSVEFQDLERVWSVLTTAGFYLTPVIYPMSMVSPSYSSLLQLNPMLHVVTGFRSALMPNDPPYEAQSAALLLASLAVALAAIVVYQTRARLISDRVIST